MNLIKTKRILFMGSPDFACPTLEMLIHEFSNSDIHICTQADKPSGRNKKISPTPIKKLALKYQKPVYTPQSKQELTTCVQTINPDLIIVVAYGFIIEKAITDHYICINIHGSLLPKYRGATPMQAALLNQDKQTGITLIKMDEGCDTGPILALQTCPIQDNDYINTLHDKLSLLGAETLKKYLKNTTQKITCTPQNNLKASYCQKINKDDLKLDLTQTAEKNLAKIRAYSPVPGAYFLHKNKRFKVLKALIADNKLIITSIKPEGKKEMIWQEACHGYPELKKIHFQS